MQRALVKSSWVDAVRPPEALAPFVPRLVAAWAGSERAGTNRYRSDGTLVSVDISGFTALSERLAARGKLGAEELIDQINAVYRELIARAHARDGDVLKFRGDALLLFFPGAGHESRATACALEMQSAVDGDDRGGVNLRMSCGLVSGACDFFLIGSSHRELVVAGPAATEVLRLEDAAGPGEIVLSESTARAVGAMPGVLPRTFSVDAPAASGLDPAAASTLADLVPGPLRALLESGGAEAEHRLATAAFVKFAGTDALVEQDPVDAADRLAETGRLVGAVADELGITWLESDIDLDGGKFYLVAGAPASSGDDEARMLIALRRILDADVPLKLRAGVNRGHVFAGLIGGETRRTYAVMGDAVNVAARLVARAEPGELLATDELLRRSRRRFETSGRPLLMKGKERAVTGYRVGRIVESAPAGEGSLPLIGREAELELLRGALDDARGRRTRTIELVGEPGIGKSRLVEELRAAAAGFQVLEARGEPYTATEAYSALRPLLRPLAGIRPEDDETAAGAQLAAFASAVAPDLAPWLPVLAIPFGASVPATPETADLDPSFRREKLLEIVETFVTRILLMPTLLIVEDSHWLDDASRELLRRLVAGEAPRPWLILATRRPEGEDVGGEHVELGPLPAEATARLVAAVAADQALADADVVRLAERSGGNPLFARELATARGDATAELPQNVETVITARIDRLEPSDRLLLRCAAVLGASFDPDVLTEVLAEEQLEGAGPTRLERLSEFVGADVAGRLRFHHDLFRAVAYEGLSYARRRDLHRGVGGVLERRRGDEAAALLSLHFFEAGEHAKAWRYSVLAGDHARAGHANVDAAELYERALAAAEGLSDARPEEVARVAESLGDVCELAARYDEAATAYRLARHLLADRPLDQARLLSKAGVLLERAARYEDAITEHEHALAELDDSGIDDEELRARLELALAGVLLRQGKLEECVAWCGLAAGNAERASARRELAHAYYLLDVATTQLGRPDERYRERALPIYEEIGDLVGQASVLNNLGIGAYYEGRWDEAVGFYRRSCAASLRAGDVASAAMVRNNEAEILSDQGRLDEAREFFEEALRAFRAARHRGAAAVCMSNLGRCAARSGRFDEAHELLEEALRDAESFGATETALNTRARLAECLVLAGRHREGFAHASDTLRRAGGGNDTRALRAMLDRLLGVAEAQDRAPDQARPHFAESLALARAAGAEFEEALTLHALAETGVDVTGEHDAEALLERLGVISLPHVPLP